ncbi:MAG: GTPase ObgE [Clostridia bacterium]|nr:GTPase ObgE [Clostridia bacterium]
MFLDVAKIYIKAGNGGNGKVGFHREKYVLTGGPDGGNGGNGGDIVFLADASMTTLYDFKFKVHFRAENGENGGQSNQTGKSGAPTIIKVPVGTIIRDEETGGVLADMCVDGESKVVLKGGRGGKGNACFATPTRRSPSFAQNGVKTVEHRVILELKTIADIGLIGFPNVGKSTLLSVMTEAKPKIANYHFTTINPNLGVVKFYDNNYVIADIPGLIEGASEGVGLGHDFLRHIERVRMLIHVVDVSGHEGRDPVEDYLTIRKELISYSEDLSLLEEIVVANKTDLAEEGAVEKFEKAIGKPVIDVCAVTHKNLDKLLKVTAETVVKIEPKTKIVEDFYEYDDHDDDSYEIIRYSDGNFEVVGGFVDMLVRNVVLSDPESFRYFQRKLKDRGIFDELRSQGAKDGDVIHIADIEFVFVD